jgi:BASS family bile acid:Na+ symporter
VTEPKCAPTGLSILTVVRNGFPAQPVMQEPSDHLKGKSMTLQSIILLVLKISIVLLVFGIGLTASRQDISHLFRRPGALLRTFFSMNIVMPVLVVAIALAFELRHPVEIGLIALAISPVPPLLPKRQAKAGATGAYAIGLLFAMAVLAIAFIPLAIELLDMIFPADLHMPFLAVVKLVLFTVLVPLLAGVTVRSFAAGFAGRIAKPVSLIATLMLVIGLLPVLFKMMPAIISLIGDGTILVFVVFVVVGLFVGHFLGGPVPEDRPVLALATASRHPAIAATIAIANFPEQRMVFPAILLYLLINAIVCLPYMVRVRRRNASRAVTSSP